MFKTQAFYVMTSLLIGFGFLLNHNNSIHRDYAQISKEILDIKEYIEFTNSTDFIALNELSKKNTRHTEVIADFEQFKAKINYLQSFSLPTRKYLGKALLEESVFDQLNNFKFGLSTNDPLLSECYFSLAISERLAILLDSINDNFVIDYTPELIISKEPEQYHLGRTYSLDFDIINRPKSNGQVKIVNLEDQAEISINSFPILVESSPKEYNLVEPLTYGSPFSKSYRLKSQVPLISKDNQKQP